MNPLQTTWIEQSAVSSRVALLLRSTEAKLAFNRFVHFYNELYLFLLSFFYSGLTWGWRLQRGQKGLEGKIILYGQFTWGWRLLYKSLAFAIALHCEHHSWKWATQKCSAESILSSGSIQYINFENYLSHTFFQWAWLVKVWLGHFELFVKLSQIIDASEFTDSTRILVAPEEIWWVKLKKLVARKKLD